jgi:serine/threonine-protein kinase
MDAPVPARALRGDLDAIVERALRKVPAHRYPTVRELRDDVLAHIEGRAVKSRGGAFLYRTGRTLKRHKMLAASVLVAVLALLAGAIGIERQSQLARAEARKEAAVKNFMLDVFRTNAVDNPDGVSARQTTAVQLLDRGAKAVSEDTKSSPEVRGEFIDELADLYDQFEDFGRVEQLERQRVKDLDREGGQPSVARAAALAELGRALTMNQHFPEAKIVLLEALSNLDSIHDEGSPARTLALMTLGLLEYHTEPLKDSSAARHTRAALDLLVKYRPDHPDRLTAVQLLARIDEQRGDWAGAEAGYREFLRLVQTPAFGTERVALGSAYGDLANFLLARGRYDEAELDVRKSIEILDQAEGPDQANSFERHMDLAKIYIGTYRDAEAEPLLRKLVNGTFQDAERAGLGRRAMGLLVDLDLSTWRLSEAETLLQKNRSFLLNNPDADRDLRSMTAASWARLLAMQGRFDEASHAQAEAAALYANDMGEPSEAARANAVLGGDIAGARGQWQEAKDQYRKLPPASASAYSVASARQSLGLGRVELHDGGPQQAIFRASEVLAQIEALPSGRRPLMLRAEAHELAAGAAQAAGDYPTAAVHLQEQISTLESLSAPKPVIASVKNRLAAAQRAIAVKGIVTSSLPAAASATREL